jgi:DNA-binding transcriptional ArsR family regulator
MADDSPAAPYPTHGPALGAAELRALSHPLRLRILDELSMYGPLTASGLGERLGESSGSTSYHLRQLEKVGLVEETVGKGNARERWWERRAGSITFPDPSDFPAGSADRLAARLLGEEALRGRDQAFREFIAQDEGAIGEEWQRVAVVNTVNLKLLPEQLHALILEIDQVVARYIAAYRTTPSPGARPVQVQLNAFPLARGRETLPDEPATEGSAE